MPRKKGKPSRKQASTKKAESPSPKQRRTPQSAKDFVNGLLVELSGEDTQPSEDEMVQKSGSEPEPAQENMPKGKVRPSRKKPSTWEAAEKAESPLTKEEEYVTLPVAPDTGQPRWMSASAKDLIKALLTEEVMGSRGDRVDESMQAKRRRKVTPSPKQPSPQTAAEKGDYPAQEREFDVLTIDPSTTKLRPLSQSTKDFVEAVLKETYREVLEIAGDEMDEECAAMVLQSQQCILSALEEQREPEDSVDILDLERKTVTAKRSLNILQAKVDELTRINSFATMELERLRIAEDEARDEEAVILQESAYAKRRRLQLQSQ